MIRSGRMNESIETPVCESIYDGDTVNWNKIKVGDTVGWTLEGMGKLPKPNHQFRVGPFIGTCTKVQDNKVFMKVESDAREMGMNESSNAHKVDDLFLAVAKKKFWHFDKGDQFYYLVDEDTIRCYVSTNTNSFACNLDADKKGQYIRDISDNEYKELCKIGKSATSTSQASDDAKAYRLSLLESMNESNNSFNGAIIDRISKVVKKEFKKNKYWSVKAMSSYSPYSSEFKIEFDSMAKYSVDNLEEVANSIVAKLKGMKIFRSVAYVSYAEYIMCTLDEEHYLDRSWINESVSVEDKFNQIIKLFDENKISYRVRGRKNDFILVARNQLDKASELARTVDPTYEISIASQL